MFAWAPIPDQFAHLGSLEFAKLLIQETGVAVAPGVGFGEYGDQYVRLALVENEQRIRQAARNIKKFLGGSSRATATSCRSPVAKSSDSQLGHAGSHPAAWFATSRAYSY